MKKSLVVSLPYVILLTALGSMLGSLYISEIIVVPPCDLCWWQRIALYPIVPIAAVGILLKDKNFPLYVLPLAVIGWLINIYHNLLYYNIIPEPIIPCRSGVSCTDQILHVFGFIDVPQGAFLAFTFLIICSIMLMKLNRK